MACDPARHPEGERVLTSPAGSKMGGHSEMPYFKVVEFLSKLFLDFPRISLATNKQFHYIAYTL